MKKAKIIGYVLLIIVVTVVSVLLLKNETVQKLLNGLSKNKKKLEIQEAESQIEVNRTKQNEIQEKIKVLETTNTQASADRDTQLDKIKGLKDEHEKLVQNIGQKEKSLEELNEVFNSMFSANNKSSNS